ncbi:MAG: polysaccharide pyruvyl transferase family protein, partial [Clostridia bacterium]|nr:polysaccharide pyruvyl transferase family protein [Clostridia bacterium]
MKTAIVTIFGDNFGNKLQNYALQTLLESLGHEARTINIKGGGKLHRIESLSDKVSKLSPGYLKQVASSRFKNKYPYKNQRDGIFSSIRFGKTGEVQRLTSLRQEAFRAFSDKNLKLDERTYVTGCTDFEDRYDAYICGSDQIWNPTYSSTGAAYFLGFAPVSKRIAFAPSFGLSSIPEELHPLYKKWLNDIPYLSVREEAGARIIKEITGRDAAVLPDPTLCIPREKWESFERKPDFAGDDSYVLTYFLGNETNKYRRYIEKYADGRRIINLFDMREPEYFAADPAEFVWLIHHAEAMFTDSFHGTVFSLIFHTPFTVFDRIESGGSGMSSRIETLLKMAGLEDRRFGSAKDAEIDFSHFDNEVKRQVEKAGAFLSDALAQVKPAPEMNVSPYVLPEKSDCSGCAACVEACPLNCITMKTDEEGFRYPVIDR